MAAAMARRNCRRARHGRLHLVAAALTLSLLGACVGPGEQAARTIDLGPPATHGSAPVTPTPGTASTEHTTAGPAPAGGPAASDAQRHGHGLGPIGPCTGPRRRVACVLEAARDRLYRRPDPARTSTVFVPGTTLAAAVERDLRILRRHRAARLEVGQHLRLHVTHRGPGHFSVRVDETLHADRVIGPHGTVLSQRRYGPAPRRFSILYTRGGPFGYRIADVTRLGAPVVTEL